MKTLWQVDEEWPIFNHYFNKTKLVKVADDFHPQPGDALILWGGPDVSPTYYWDTPIVETCSIEDRDKLDWSCLTKAVDFNIPIIGICRGMQIIAPFVGGSLIQHTTGHNGTQHVIIVDPITKYPNLRVNVNSWHHQMIRAFQGELNVIGRTATALSSEHKVGPASYEVNNISFEVEMIVAPDIKAIGMQFHPEYEDAPEESIDLAQYLVKRYILENQW